MKALSLFSGIGGFDLAAERAGIEIVAQCDSDKRCQEILQRNWPRVRYYTDVREVGPDVGKIDFIFGGFPCQDISQAGRLRGLAGEKSGLFSEFARCIKELRPRWVLIENVPAILHTNGGRDMGAILGTLAEFGMGFAYRVFDSQFFGVPQARRRLFIVGCTGYGVARQVLFDGEELPRDSQEARAIRASMPSASPISFDRPVAVAENQRAEIRLMNVFPALASRTSSKPGQGSAVVYYQGKLWRASAAEYERLMAFPEGWTEGFTDYQRRALLGNAVVVSVAEWIINRIVKYDV